MSDNEPPPPSSGERIDAPKPSPASRVTQAPPPAGARVASPTPSPSARVDVAPPGETRWAGVGTLDAPPSRRSRVGGRRSEALLGFEPPSSEARVGSRTGPKRRPFRAELSLLISLLPAGFIALAVFAANLPYRHVFVGTDQTTGTALIVGSVAVLVALAHIRSIPVWVTAPVVALDIIVFAGAFAYPDSMVAGVIPTPEAVADLWDGATTGWRTLLTTGWPADPEGVFLAGPLVTAGLAAFLACQLGLKSSAASSAFVPVLAVLGLSLAMTAGADSPGLGLSALVLASFLGFLGTRAAIDERTSVDGRPSSERRGATGWIWILLLVPAIGLFVGIGVALGGLTGVTDDAERFDLRDRVDPPVEVRDSITPLSRLSLLLESLEPDQPDAVAPPAFSITLSTPAGGAATVDRIPTAILDSYDGALWSTSATFVRPGSKLPAEAQPTDQLIEFVVDVAQHPTSFLPVPGTALTLRGAEVGYDAATGRFVADADSAAGFSYEGTAAVTTRLPDLSSAQPGEAEELLALPAELPLAIEEFNEAVTAGFAGTGDRLQQIIEAVQGQLYNPLSRSGHSLARLEQFLAERTEDDFTGIGTEEQGAALVAVLARMNGVPSRVVVGYRMPADATPGQPTTVTFAEAAAWVEVLLEGRGWVALDTTNRDNRGEINVDPVDQGLTEDPEILEDLEELIDDDFEPGDILPPEDEFEPCPADVCDTGGTSLLSRLGPWALGFLAIATLVFVPPLLTARRRRRRRRADDTATRTVGAWLELRETMQRDNTRITEALSAREALWLPPGNLDASPVDPDVAARLPPLIDVALYADDRPSPEIAEEAWLLADRERDDVIRRRSLHRRIWAWWWPAAVIRDGLRRLPSWVGVSS